MSFFNAEERFVEEVLRDVETYRQDHAWMKEEVLHSEAYYKGSPVPFLYMPRLITPSQLEDLRSIVKRSNAIFEKVIRRYETDARYRATFAFPKLMEELILLPTPLEWPVPMARYDVFYRGEDDFTFCEINTDGSSAMNEDRVFTEIMLRSKARDILEPMEPYTFELFRTWVESFKSHFAPGELRRVAILDTGKIEESFEFLRFRDTFREAGIACDLANPEDLIFDGEWIRQNGEQVDAIYRRLVTSDFFHEIENHMHLVQAMKQGKTVWIGPVKTQVIHNKRVFYVLHLEEFQDMFTQEEKEFIKKHVPYTAELTKNRLTEELIEDKDNYLLKPPDSYAAKGVLAGRKATPEEWKKALEEGAGSGMLLQRFAELPKIRCIDFEAEGDTAIYHHITGLFVYDGELAGIFSRASRQEMIAEQYDGRTLPTFGVKNEI